MKWCDKLWIAALVLVLILAIVGVRHIFNELDYLYETREIKFVRKYRETNRLYSGDRDAFIHATLRMCPIPYPEYLEEAEERYFYEHNIYLSEAMDSLFKAENYVVVVAYEESGRKDTLYIDHNKSNHGRLDEFK